MEHTYYLYAFTHKHKLSVDEDLQSWIKPYILHRAILSFSKGIEGSEAGRQLIKGQLGPRHRPVQCSF